MVKHSWNRAKALLIILALWGPASTVESVPVAGDRENVLSEKKPTEKTELERLRRVLRQQAKELQRYKSAEYQIEFEYYKKYHKYLAEKADVNLGQFKWQTRAAEFLMWLVVAVVLAGVVYSGVQMWRASRTGDITAGSSVEITTQNIKMTSSVSSRP